MLKYILKFLNSSKKTCFDRKYRDGYNNQWIKNIRDYYP